MDAQGAWSVEDVGSSQRYELRRDGELIGFASYRRTGQLLAVPHVETLVEHRGNRFSEILMAGIVDDARARSFRIDPVCPHFATYLDRRPDTAAVDVRPRIDGGPTADRTDTDRSPTGS
jgi:hypothetical protein